MTENGKNSDPDSLEIAEEKATKYLYQRFFVLPVVGGVFGFHQTRWWSIFTKTVFTAYYVSVLSTIVTLSYSSYLNRDNMAVASGCIHILITAFVVLGISLTLQRLRKDVVQLLSLDEIICEYQCSEYLSNLIRKSDQKLRFLLIFWVALYGSSAWIAVIFPFIDVYFGYELSLSNVTDVYWKGLPFASWWPMDADNSNLAWTTCFMSQGLYAFFAASSATSGMLCFAIFSEDIFNHIKLLVNSIERLEKRAKLMFKMLHPGKSLRNSLDEYDECYYNCILQNVKHHQKIVIKKDLLMKIANIPVAVPFFGGAMLLGLAGINLLSDGDIRIAPKVLFTCLGVTEAAQMFLLCHYGEQFRTQSELLFNATFYTKCYRRSMKCKRAMMIFRLGVSRPMAISAAKLIVLNMGTFANLVNSAYSIFNLQSITTQED
ncbi:hypothetical protein GE061_010242 [Apolygus lucorum]|uniref:Odorant receptor n=1 Tax=Apolygus lucorum TaxID=248454 RepID=A0A6A4KFF7_APOLU|nr:hypothetical protein GE061_010242 [Apolygus lucorum]